MLIVFDKLLLALAALGLLTATAIFSLLVLELYDRLKDRIAYRRFKRDWEKHNKKH